jgi:hypothetical protein
MGFDERQDGLGVEVHAAHLVDTEFRGVAGTLMVNATLESKVRYLSLPLVRPVAECSQL